MTGGAPVAGWEKIVGEMLCEMGDYVHLLDANGVILHTSSGVIRSMGYAPHEFSGKDGFASVHPDDLAEAQSRFHRFLETGAGAEQVEYRFRSAGGEYRWLEVLRKNYLDNPAVGGVVALCRDITQRKQSEEALACRSRELADANELLEQALRVKDEFLTSTSHELRAPLTVIIGQSEILRDEIHGKLNEKQLKAVRSVESGGRHLLSLINDILDLSRIEAAMLELYPETVNVEMLCASCLMFVKQEAHGKEVSVGLTLDPLVSSFQGDPRRVRQILVNLLVNAVKFTPQGGEVGLEVTGDRERRRICFTVRDTGVGVADDDLERLFIPFVQLDSRLNRGHEGSGLGLALVKQLSRLHGGTVTVTSRVGMGSRFTVTLPWEEVDSGSGSPPRFPPAIPEPGPLAPFPHAPLILVVDDSSATVEMMQGYLRNRDYRVIGATSGAAALAAVRSDSPTLVLMDIQMPGMDGLEAIRQIRALPPPEGEVPIIALTALAMRGDRERCLEAGADDYLSKPVSMKNLNDQIRTLLKNAGERNSRD